MFIFETIIYGGTQSNLCQICDKLTKKQNQHFRMISKDTIETEIDFFLMLADALLKTVIVLSEIRIA